jgi:glycosyltransferase involved in cell wall biosynthesis
LNPSSDLKFRGLSGLGEVFVVGFSPTARPRRFVRDARFYLLPSLPLPILRYALMFTIGPILALWLIWRHRVRILVAQSPYEGLVAAVAKRAGRWIGRDVALIVESHGDFEESVFLQRRVHLERLYRAVMRWAASYALNRADVLRAVSDSTREQIERWVHDKPLIQFPTWTNIDAFLEAGLQRRPAGKPVLLYGGVLVRRKGVHHLISAFGQISASHPDARLVLASHDAEGRYLDTLRTQIRDLHLTDRVELVGPLSQDELAEQMRTSHVFILPTYSEGLPRVVFEAMAAGLPVVATRVSGIPEIVEDGVTGLLVEPGEEQALADCLLWMLQHTTEAAEMGRLGRERARGIFSRAAYVEGYRRMFDLARSLPETRPNRASPAV